MLAIWQISALAQNRGLRGALLSKAIDGLVKMGPMTVPDAGLKFRVFGEQIECSASDARSLSAICKAAGIPL